MTEQIHEIRQPKSSPRAVALAPEVIAIVLNWNRESDTAACVDSLLKQRGVALEILVVDNGSPDGSGERLRDRYPALHYLQTGENLGYAGGNNCGIEWCMTRGVERVLVINNDTVVDPDCVRKLLHAARSDDRIAALAPLIVRHDDPERIWFAGGTQRSLTALGRHDNEGAPVLQVVGDDSAQDLWRKCSFLTGCCLLLRVDAIAEQGAFRADFFSYVEDVELSLRLSNGGWLLGWVPDARITHRVPPVGTQPAPWQIVLRDRNRRRVVREYYSKPRRAAFTAWFLVTRLASLMQYAMAGDGPRFRAIIKGMRER